MLFICMVCTCTYEHVMAIMYRFSTGIDNKHPPFSVYAYLYNLLVQEQGCAQSGRDHIN